MREGTMWLLVIALAAIVSGQDQDFLYTTYLDGAALGINPSCVNTFKNPDPGKRAQILQPLRTPVVTATSEVVPKNFIEGIEHLTCVPRFNVQTASSYVEYLDLASSDAYHDSYGSITNALPQFPRYDNSALCEAWNRRRDTDMLQFFKDTRGEVRVVSTECFTHTITVLPLATPTFTPAFENALARLYEAALDPDSETSDKTFSDFIWSYGTHFSKQTILGAQVQFGKLFPTQIATIDEDTTRRHCLVEAAKEALRPCRQGCNETIRMRFARASSEMCGETEHEVFVAVRGPLPEGSLADWALVAEEYPDPVFHVLEPISTLFTRDWLSSEAGPININQTILQNYFKMKLANYTTGMLSGHLQQTALKGCGVNSRCGPKAECLNELETESGYRCVPKTDVTSPPRLPPMTCVPATPTPTTPAAPPATGAIVIVGGRSAWDTHSTPNSLALFGPAPPLFPVAVSGNTLSSVGTQLYSCGGSESNESKRCWYIDTRAQGTWQSFAIPWRLAGHCAVAVKDEIWFFLHTKLMILNTMKTEDKFREIDLGFSVYHGSAAVAHGSKIFVIGVGGWRNDIYVNTNSSEPEQWEVFTQLLEGRQYFGCITVGAEIFVTGGRDMSKSNVYFSSVEVISVVNRTVRSISPLGGARRSHQMAIIQGRPAVLGGWNGTHVLATIETYDEESDSWETLGASLGEPRYSFGLTQYSP